MKKIKIDFIGIGAPRSGTSWVAKILMQHPQICFPGTKELNYFSHTRANKTKSEYEINGIEGYLKLFGACKPDSKKGEFSTYYMSDPAVAPIIKKHFPDVKIIVCLREPSERAFSDYQNVKEGSLQEELSFEEAFFNDKMNLLDSYKERGMYFKNLSPYYKLFPRKNIKVILFDDIKSKPDKVIRDLYSFLEVDPEFIPRDKSPEGVVKKTKFKSLRKSINALRKIYNFLESTSIGKQLTFIKRKTRINEFFNYINKKNNTETQKQTINPELKSRIKKIYRSDLNKLEKLIKRDLSSWKA